MRRYLVQDCYTDNIVCTLYQGLQIVTLNCLQERLYYVLDDANGKDIEWEAKKYLTRQR